MKFLAGFSALLFALVLSAPAVQAGPLGSFRVSASSAFGNSASFGLSLQALQHSPRSQDRNSRRTVGRRLSVSCVPSRSRTYPSYGNPRRGYASASYRVWVPGRWVVKTNKVWIPANTKKIWHAPVFETRFNHCGDSIQLQVSAGHYETISTPGHFEYRKDNVWQEPHWETRW